jgi:diadenosine tetraphosphate (Ap4A) HIT family hydrolase
MSDRSRSPRPRSWSNPVKAWTDPERWARVVTSEGCPFCTTEPYGVFVDLPASRALIPDAAVLPGYVLVVSKRHVVEPYELPRAEGRQFWDDVMRTAAAVASAVIGARCWGGQRDSRLAGPGPR